MLQALLCPVFCCGSAQPNNGVDSPGRELVVIDPSVPELGLLPGSQRVIRVRYMTRSGIPLPGAEIRFAIFGDPRGSTLSADKAMTDGDGVAVVELRAGAASSTFKIRISAGETLQKIAYVEVSEAGFGAVRVGLAYPDGDSTSTYDNVEFLLYDSLGCSQRSPYDPPEPIRRRSSTSADSVRLGALPLDRDQAILALVRNDDGDVRAAGCIDLPAELLSSTLEMTVSIAIVELPPFLAGTYELSSVFVFPRDDAVILAVFESWMDLTRCDLDPAQRLLDCIVDAKYPDGVLDCSPTAATSAEAAAVLAERGLIQSGCRRATTARGSPSLEQVLYSQMSAHSPQFLEHLGQVASIGTSTLARLRLSSELSIRFQPDWREARAGIIRAAHSLRSVGFAWDSAEVAYPFTEIASPMPEAHDIQAEVVPIEPAEAAGGSNTAAWQLQIGEHHLSLRFDKIAQAALNVLVLKGLALPPGSVAVVRQLTQMITDKSAEPGCPAIAQQICERTSMAPCPADFVSACEQAVIALAELLDAGFSALRQPGSDLLLAGRVSLFDTDGDLRVDTLGAAGSLTEGQWTRAQLQLNAQAVDAEQATFTGAPPRR